MRDCSRIPVRLGVCLLALLELNLNAAELGMGFRVGEVTQTSAVVWTRITRDKERVWNGFREPKGQPLDSPSDVPIESRDGAMPGASGEVRLVVDGEDGERLDQPGSDWIEVSAENDFCHQFVLTNLEPGKRYSVRLEARPVGGDEATSTADGAFRTAGSPAEWQDVSFAVVTGQAYKDLDHREGFNIYPAMQRLDLDFLVPTGDTVYLDSEAPRAKSVELARHHWHRMYSLPRHIEFHRRVPGYWEVDDHDSWLNDCWPGMKSKLMEPLTFEQGFAVFREQVPLGDHPTHRTIRWGKGLQIWLVEGRLYRSPNRAPDGPDKTIWGQEQRDWLMQSVLDSDADFKVLISPTPIIGPDRGNKADNHANDAFTYEGNLFRNWTAEHRLDNFFVCCGDRHWQYLSIDPATKLHEFSCGPASDQHAGGSPGAEPGIQPYHRVKGGFLEVRVSREDDRPTISLRHREVNGGIQNEFRVQR
ncbi:MAG: alkaline phosphatase D family protein [Planctomycetaceae bacterium]|nr:alkaline phosphatase D family protein [Planctomycetaceae bacterium]